MTPKALKKLHQCFLCFTVGPVFLWAAFAVSKESPFCAKNSDRYLSSYLRAFHLNSPLFMNSYFGCARITRAMSSGNHATVACSMTELNDLLKKFQVARVTADPSCVPTATEPGGKSDLVYFRLHGSPRRYYSSYDFQFLNKLATKLRQMPTKSRIWCILDNTATGAAIQNALDLRTACSERI